MNIEGNYEIGYEIEGQLKHQYTEALKRIKESDGLKECLENLCLMFNLLGKSRPDAGAGFNWCPEKDIKWARDMIEAYRKFGKLFEIFKHDYLSQIEEFKKIKIKENSDLINKFGGEKDSIYDKINSLLDYFHDINQALEEHGIGSAEDLGNKLEFLDKMEYNSERLGNLETEFENFERDFS